MSHFLKTYAHILTAFLLALFAGAGISFTGGLIAGALVSAFASGLMLVTGVGFLIALRRIFNLAQSGKLIQFGAFWLVWASVASLMGYVLPALLVVWSPALLGGFMLCAYLGTHVLSGEIGIYKHRSWLPIVRKGSR